MRALKTIGLAASVSEEGVYFTSVVALDAVTLCHA
jgi:hypothetical protein